uniref:Uncharacterized protein n=1 Tax=Oryza sativa subsp. japonica TaxID=39947 RepID=Q2R8U2_ORYSJ|nr:hypothetical protein LOC_Os11g11010 [Oryza sativa Japonica Group]
MANLFVGAGTRAISSSRAKKMPIVIVRRAPNGKHRKINGDREINGDANLKAHITTYYKGLLALPEASSLTLDESQISDISQVSQLENNALVQDFSEEEIKDATFQMEHNKASGPDGFPAEFYQVF